MQLCKCNQGHYFDKDKYAACPYCAGGAGESQVTVPLAQETPAGGNVTAPAGDSVTMPASAGGPGAAAQAAAAKVIAQAEAAARGQSASAEEPRPAEPAFRQEEPAFRQPEPVSQMWRAPQANGAGGPVSNPAAWGEDANKTVSYYSESLGVEPVVGWLTAVAGEYFGESFQLKTGRNFVGRSPEMDIQLSLDRSVSRRKHAVIIYEPKSRTFIAQPGDSRELFYVNDEVVLNNVVLKAYDILHIGNSELLFIPLCGEKFSWDDAKRG